MLSDIFAELLIRSLTLQYSHWDSNPERTDFESAAYAIPPWKLMMMWFLANCLHLYVSHYSDNLRTYKILLQEPNLRYYRWRAVACHYTKKQSMSLKTKPTRGIWIPFNHSHSRRWRRSLIQHKTELGWGDSNPRVRESKSRALPLGDSPTEASIKFWNYGIAIQIWIIFAKIT